MDQAASADQGLLRNQRQRSQADLDRSMHLSPDRHPQEAIEDRIAALHNSQRSEPLLTGEDPHRSGVSGVGLHKRR